MAQAQTQHTTAAQRAPPRRVFDQGRVGVVPIQHAGPRHLRAAHARNDEVLERIYIGRRFRNDTERLEKLFELYTKMTSNAPKEKGTSKKTQGK